jgi:hypothetical protein
MSGGYQCQSGYEWASEGCSTLSSSLSKAANWTNLTQATGAQVSCKRTLRKGDRGPNCTDFRQLNSTIAEAQSADQIVLAVGIDQSITGEGRDRANITLPGQQGELVSRVLALGKPTVMVLVNGATLGIEMYVNAPNLLAIVESWQPGVQGMTALAPLLLGHENRWYVACASVLHRKEISLRA